MSEIDPRSKPGEFFDGLSAAERERVLDRIDERLSRLREQNDEMGDHEQTAYLRGRIAELKRLRKDAIGSVGRSTFAGPTLE